jgi:hypothetical protein
MICLLAERGHICLMTCMISPVLHQIMVADVAHEDGEAEDFRTSYRE